MLKSIREIRDSLDIIRDEAVRSLAEKPLVPWAQIAQHYLWALTATVGVKTIDLMLAIAFFLGLIDSEQFAGQCFP